MGNLGAPDGQHRSPRESQIGGRLGPQPSGRRDGLLDEQVYDATRAEQALYRAERDHGLTRRHALKLIAAGIPLAAAAAHLGSPAPAAAAPRPRGLAARGQTAPGPIVKPLPPGWFIVHGTNAETRWDALRDQGYFTPNERFFVRNHSSTPAIDPASWRLQVFGSGLRDPEGIELSYDDLVALPSRSVVSAVECAGNGRSLFADQQGTPARGTAWKLGAIGVARWRGVPLSEVLDRAGLRRRGAVDVMAQGLDATVVSGGVDLGHVRRPIPLDKALENAFVVYEMNGEALPPDHGFPARLLVPGWVGIANVKWLGQIEVSDQALFSAWNTTQYRMTGPDYPADAPPLTTQPAKSAFELPWEAQLPAGRQRLSGRSWSGTSSVRRVEVSTDGGASWRQVRTRPGDDRRGWQRWDLEWRPPGPGSYELLARATDRAGQTQPDTVPFNDNGYQFWAVARHPVTVAA